MTKNILYNTIACIAFVAASMLAIGCVASSPGAQTVLTNMESLKEGTIMTPGPGQEAAPIEVSKLPPALKEFAQKTFPDVPVLVVTTVDHVKPAIPAVIDNPATPENEAKPAVQPPLVPITPPGREDGTIDFATWIAQAGPALSGIVPSGVAPWLPLIGLISGSLVSKRSRGHLGDAVSNLNPFDEGYVDITGAAGSLKKAVGWSHSTQTPAELRALANKLEAEQAADASLQAVAKK